VLGEAGALVEADGVVPVEIGLDHDAPQSHLPGMCQQLCDDRAADAMSSPVTTHRDAHELASARVCAPKRSSANQLPPEFRHEKGAARRGVAGNDVVQVRVAPFINPTEVLA